MIFKSACLKLTISYVLIVMAISITFSFVLYGIASHELNTGLRRQGTVLENLPGPAPFPGPMSELERVRSEQLNESNKHLELNLIYFNLLILALAGGLSYFLARRTLKPIEEMLEMQNHFTSDASHELRTPLTAMKAEIEISLRDKKFNLAEAKKLLKSNLEEIAKLDALSSGLLKLTNYQSRKKMIFAKHSLVEIIENAIAKTNGLAKTKQIKIQFDQKDITINCEKESLIELFVILLDNAVKYSPRHSKINITTEIIGKRQVVIKVKDEGMGIKASDIPYIFNRFYRADHSRSKEKSDGYGLGLSIAMEIVKLHHGKIEVESKLNSGSTFVVKLPLGKV